MRIARPSAIATISIAGSPGNYGFMATSAYVHFRLC
jgi:hypothetical protein